MIILGEYTIVAPSGQILCTLIEGTLEGAEANTPEGCHIISRLPPTTGGYYWDFGIEDFVPLPKAPTPYHTFDYTMRKWVDSRTLYEIKDRKWDELKIERDRLEFGGFEFEEGVYDSDQVSQGRIMGAASAGIDQVWTLADNTTVELSASQLQQLYAALQAHVASVHERGRIARQAIYNADTREGVEAVQL